MPSTSVCWNKELTWISILLKLKGLRIYSRTVFKLPNDFLLLCARLQQFLAFSETFYTLNTLVFFYSLSCKVYLFLLFCICFVCFCFLFLFCTKKENVSKCTLPSWCYKLFHSISLNQNLKVLWRRTARGPNSPQKVAWRSERREFVAMSRVRLIWLDSL